MSNKGQHFEVLDWTSTDSATKLGAVSIGGPAWFSDGEYVEGLLVQFRRDDGSTWVGKFGYGSTGLDKILEFPSRDRIIIFAHGLSYIVNSEEQKGESTTKIPFSFESLLTTKDGQLVTYDFTDIFIIETNGDIWVSGRISWDGIKDLTIADGKVSGLSWDPTNSIEPWCPFTLDLKTKEIVGGSYRSLNIPENERRWTSYVI